MSDIEYTGTTITTPKSDQTDNIPVKQRVQIVPESTEDLNDLLAMNSRKSRGLAREAAKRLSVKYGFSYRDWKHNRLSINVVFDKIPADLARVL